MKEKKIILAIAGSDPSGGAGIQADIRTADAIGLYTCSVVTALTAQNSKRVAGVWRIDNSKLESQLQSVLEDLRPDAVKIGLLPFEDSLNIIVKTIQDYDLNNIVVDPILSLSLSKQNPNKSLAEAYIRELFPLATLVTPNIPEKEFFESVAGEIFDNLCDAYLLKGGHGDGNYCIDRLVYHILKKSSGGFQSTSFPTLNNNTQPFLPGDLFPLSDGEYSGTIETKEFAHRRINTTNTHGTGCVLSTAIACYLAEEYHLEKAVEAGLKFTYNALKESANYKLGNGQYGPTLI